MSEVITKSNVVLPEKTSIEVYDLGEKSSVRYAVTEATAIRHLITHKECDNCGHIYEKKRYCEPCSKKRSQEKYSNMPFKDWDGITPLVDWSSNQFFWNLEEIEDHIEKEGDNLQLVICEPHYCNELDEEYFHDAMPENWDQLADFDKGLVEKIEELNKYIRSLKVMSWHYGHYRTAVNITEGGKKKIGYDT